MTTKNGMEPKVDVPSEAAPSLRETGAVQPKLLEREREPSAKTQKAEVDALFPQATKGQPQAMHDLLALAGNEKGERIERETAIRYLGMHGSVEALVGVAQQLLSIDPRMRTAAYYSLPDSVRPVNYDYTEKPSETSRKAVAAVVERIRQNK